MEEKIGIITYGELKEFLAALTEDQLAQEVKILGESDCWRISGVEILTEDHINPSGDGMEPISAYKDAEYDDYDKEVVAPKGSVFLHQAI